MPMIASSWSIKSTQSSAGSHPYRLETIVDPTRCPVQTSSQLTQTYISGPRFLGVVLLVTVLYIGFKYDISLREPQLRASVLFNEYRSAFNQKVTPPLEPSGQVIEDYEIFSMLPPEDFGLNGLLIYFHACSRSGQDMFRLPEERILVMSAIRRGLVVLSVTSSDNETGCWTQDDVKRISESDLISKFLLSYNLPTALPRIGIGSSSGGSLLFSAYEPLKLSSIASYLVEDGYSADQLRKATTLPATVFVHMTRDTRIKLNVQKQASALKSLGVPHKVVKVKPHPFTAELCDRRLPEFGDRRCRLFLQRIHILFPGLMDKDNNVLKSYDSGEWKAVFEDSKLDDELRHVIGAAPPPLGHLSPLHFNGHSWTWTAMMEEISVSFAEHEMTCEHRDQILDFLMKNAGIENRFAYSYLGDTNNRRGLLSVFNHPSFS